VGRLNARVGAAVALVAVWAAACRPQESSPEKGPAGFEREVAKAIPGIEKQVGLPFKTPPKVESRSKSEVRQFLLREFDQSAAAKELAESELAYKRFGLLPDTLHLRQLLLNVLTEQIIGFYDPRTKTLYVVDGSAPEVVAITVQHELVHALQDQYLNLDSVQNVTGENDRSEAAQAVIEGEAMYEQLSMMVGENNLATRLQGGWDRVRDLIRDQQSSMPQFSAAPMLIQETLLFPYLSGAEFMRRFKDRKSGSAPFADLPASTEQVLHTDAFFGRRDPPITVTISAPRGATVRYTNTLGEFETRLFLFQHLGSAPDAARGAAGWGGDRYAMVDTPGGSGLVWVTVWDTGFDAAEFNDLLAQAVPKRYPGAVEQASQPSIRVWRAGNRTVRVSAVTVAGHSGVIYTDMPATFAGEVLDPSGITARP
jgi:hypothetical protein